MYEDGAYNLNVVSEIGVTDSFMTLDPSTRACQNQESYETCTSGYLKENILSKCGCMPWKLGIYKVFSYYDNKFQLSKNCFLGTYLCK